MKMKSQAICTGIKESSGTFEETKKAFSSTTFHLIVDVAENSAGRSIGSVSRPFKFGDATEFEKWAHLGKSWPVTGLLCDCEFDVVAGADNASKLTLVGIKPAPQQQARAAA
ncbi:hypothetical protein PMI15_03036 [Polaromonas sp. CF318]|uniref:hypothetical protein n=1 Tax=Polaromonas sp. CF318 TaxID=1144318 RepID=UPI000270E336|nr:hypothetical protein [Polaromonas sp. CF318]EJL82433.1 hypothetical protein PMI15_03036 [Polaromonas sp. CF318]